MSPLGSLASTGATSSAGPGAVDRTITTLAMDSGDPSVLYAGTADGLFRSTCGAARWERLATPRGRAMVYVDPLPPSTLYALVAGAGSLRLVRSGDGGHTWVDLSGAGAPAADGHALGLWFRPVSGGSAVCMWGVRAGRRGLFQSRDQGETWARLEGKDEAQAAALKDGRPPLPGAARCALTRFLVTGESHPAHVQTNVTVVDAVSGAVVSGTTGVPLVDPWKPSLFYLGTERGVYKSTDGGATWVSASAGLPAG
jgi:hypothetical protein